MHEIVQYEPRLLAQVATLQTRLWSPDAGLNERHFRWKHEQNPCLPEPVVFVALHAGRAIAMRGFFGSCWETGAGHPPLLLPVATDAVVADGWENSGITRSLMTAAMGDLARRGFPCVLNLTASPVTLMSSLAAGWRATAPLEALRLPAPRPLASAIRGRLQRTPALWRLAGGRLFDARAERRPFSEADQRGPARLRRVSSALTFEREPDVGGMTNLIGRLASDGRLRQVRDQRWLAWRYANPLAAYRFLCCRSAQLDGFVAFGKSRSRHADRLRVTVMDCEAADADVVKLMLQGVRALFPAEPVIVWRRALPQVAATMLEPAGFRPDDSSGPLARQRPCLLVKMLAGAEQDRWQLAGRDPVDVASWDLRRLYAD